MFVHRKSKKIYGAKYLTLSLTWLLTLSCSEEQFHLLCLNWYWHSSMARTAPSRTESMKPGLRLQNLTWKYDIVIFCSLIEENGFNMNLNIQPVV